MKLLVVALVPVMLATLAHAQVYKCKSPSGALVYSDAPCEVGRGTGKTLNIDPNANSVQGSRSGAESGRRLQSSDDAAMSTLRQRSAAISERTSWLTSKGNLTVDEIIQLKQLRAEQQNVQREMMILSGQDTTSFDNERRLDRLEKDVRRVERQNNNVNINGRPCTRFGNNVTC